MANIELNDELVKYLRQCADGLAAILSRSHAPTLGEILVRFNGKEAASKAVAEQPRPDLGRGLESIQELDLDHSTRTALSDHAIRAAAAHVAIARHILHMANRDGISEAYDWWNEAELSAKRLICEPLASLERRVAESESRLADFLSQLTVPETAQG